MVKPATLDGYRDEYTLDCERVLVTLLRGLGPWKDSVYLVGGLTPRYLVPARPPVVPAHAGTLDVDIVIDLQILADTEAYHTLEENLKRMGFERAENEQGVKLSWRWQTRTEHGALMVLELLADAPQIAGGRVQPLPTEGTISALNIPHSSIVFDLYQVAEIRAELLGGNGVATERVKHADIVSFTCLKAFAFDQRFERKDAHDLVYCIEHAPEGLDAVVAAFARALARGPLHSWYEEALKAKWRTPQDIKDQYASASICGNNRVVFNVGGNKYRLVVEVQYQAGIVWVKFVGTHAQYDRIDVESVNDY